MSERQDQAIVPPEDAGCRLDGWLAGRFTYRSRTGWQQAIREGLLTLNGGRTRPARLIQAGDRVEYRIENVPEPPVDVDYTVLYADEWLALVNKPGNLPCHPSGAYFHHTLWTELRRRWPASRLANRLDRETSGIVAVAFTRDVAASFARQFANHQVRKEYLALVEGSFPDELKAAGRLLPDPVSPVRKKQTFVPGLVGPGETAITRFDCVARSGGLSLVRCRPATGRYHQLRATLFSLGFPLVGDKLYGLDDRYYLAFIEGRLTPADLARLRLGRQALHAASLTFNHPATGAATAIDAPLPPDFAACLLTHGFPERYSRAPASPPP